MARFAPLRLGFYTFHDDRPHVMRVRGVHVKSMVSRREGRLTLTDVRFLQGFRGVSGYYSSGPMGTLIVVASGTSVFLFADRRGCGLFLGVIHVLMLVCRRIHGFSLGFLGGLQIFYRGAMNLCLGKERVRRVIIVRGLLMYPRGDSRH